MPKYSYNIKETLYGEDIARLYEAAKTQEKKTLIAILWVICPRPSEIAEILKEDIFFDGKLLRIRLHTKKLGAEGAFAVSERTLEIEYSENEESGTYIKRIVEEADALQPTQRMFPKTTRWQELTINELGIEALGKKISPYHLRHSLLTIMASKGCTPDQLMYFKGAASVKSVLPYINATPVRITVAMQRKDRLHTIVGNDTPPAN